MVHKPYRVGRSRTGLGLFATTAIEKGAFIIEYRGPRMGNAQAKRLEARGNRYMYELDSRWTVDGSSRRNIARYANHSCRPNAESDVVRGKVILRAIKRIKPGEEITYDYGEEYFDLFLRPVGCKCTKCLDRQKNMRSPRSSRSAVIGTAHCISPRSCDHDRAFPRIANNIRQERNR
jgi:SET domain-containing protein